MRHLLTVQLCSFEWTGRGSECTRRGKELKAEMRSGMMDLLPSISRVRRATWTWRGALWKQELTPIGLQIEGSLLNFRRV